MELLIITAPPDEGTLYVVPEITAAGDPGVIVCVPTKKGTAAGACGCEIDCVIELLMMTTPPDEGTLNVVPEITAAGEPGVMVCVPATKGIGVVEAVAPGLLGKTGDILGVACGRIWGCWDKEPWEGASFGERVGF